MDLPTVKGKERERVSSMAKQVFNQLLIAFNFIKENIQPINDLVNDMPTVKGSLNKLHDGLKEQKENVSQFSSIINNLSAIKTVNSAHVDDSNMKFVEIVNSITEYVTTQNIEMLTMVHYEQFISSRKRAQRNLVQPKSRYLFSIRD